MMKEWTRVSPELVTLEGPFECPHCHIHISTDAIDSVLVCPNCETESQVGPGDNKEGQLLVWCEACGPGEILGPGITNPDTSVKTAVLMLDQKIKVKLPGRQGSVELPGVQTHCEDCKAKRTVTDRLAVTILRGMADADNLSALFRRVQGLLASEEGKEKE